HRSCYVLFFLVPATATSDTPPLSLHDALPIFPGKRGRTSVIRYRVRDDRPVPAIEQPCRDQRRQPGQVAQAIQADEVEEDRSQQDRKSTRLNSSHVKISYAVFCLKKKTKQNVT